MPQEPDRSELTVPSEHQLATAENGPFTHACCSCGWRGPARRARSKARDDAQEHVGTV
ncbi:hypothetical protein MTQ01_19810 [Streptomyces sp. XM4193]|uniref:hypothetical protein n=1 Tax=Streptomyces sp. XM4193 TaxID=2929782 RepID=UPI001FF7E08F|nr:hypothetical protein [Streptomyces sp. XM4193]MCK1798231.1 hypothetical protein [Streptomyces sp. XM4193]